MKRRDRMKMKDDNFVPGDALQAAERRMKNGNAVQQNASEKYHAQAEIKM